MIKKIKKGFTLVELVIVIAVIAVLSAILIPVFGNIIDSSKKGKLEANLKTISSELVTRAFKQNVPYYTPSAVRNIAAQMGFDFTSEDFFVPEGYTVWYDQANFNLRLLPDSETLLAENQASLSVYESTPVYGGVANGSHTLYNDNLLIGSDALNALPRRPEALLSNKNMLAMATSEENQTLMNSIREIYELGSNYAVGDIDRELERIAQDLLAAELITTETRDLIKREFSTEHTIYVAANGSITTLSSNNYIVKNVVFSNAAQELVGIPGTGAGEADENKYNYKFECVFEIPSKVKNVLGSVWNMVGNYTVDVVSFAGDVEIGDTLNKVNLTKAPTGTSKDSSYAGEELYIPTDTLALDYGTHYGLVYDTYSAKYSNGHTIATDLDGAYAANSNEVNVTAEMITSYLSDLTVHTVTLDDKTVTYDLEAKYITPRVWFDMEEIKKKLSELHGDGSGNVTITKIEVYERTYGDYRMISILAIYEDAQGIIRGARLGNSIGYVTNTYEYVRNDSNNYVAVEASLEESVATTAGYVQFKLPNGSQVLKDYDPANLKVTAYYREATQFFSQEKSSFGNIFYSPTELIVASGEGSEKHVELTTSANGFLWSTANDALSFARVDDPKDEKSNYYQNGVKLTRVEVVNTQGTEDTADDMVVYVKYYK